ncbi:MAG: transporter substrate-binding domain-containing protein, partial [Caldimonas sp.]
MIRSPQRRRFAIGAASVGLAAALPAWLVTARAQSVDEIKKKGELAVGLLVDFPPYGTVNSSNEPDGYDADVARLLAKDWGVKLKLVP